jgi:hypothetical protein
MATEFADLVEMVEAAGTHCVVPLELTEEMLRECAEYLECNIEFSSEEIAKRCWQVTLAARPRDIAPKGENDDG